MSDERRTGAASDTTSAGLRIERRLGERMRAFSNMVSSSYVKRTEPPFGVAGS